MKETGIDWIGEIKRQAPTTKEIQEAFVVTREETFGMFGKDEIIMLGIASIVVYGIGLVSGIILALCLI